MKQVAISLLIVTAAALTSCNTAETAVAGTVNTVGNAAQGVGRSAVIGGTGVANTVGGTMTTAGTGIAEGNLKQATIGTATAAGTGTVKTIKATGSNQMKTAGGVIKDTGTTVKDTSEAASKE